MSFTHLHLHSIYSILDGIGTSLDYVKKAKEFGHTAIALTDHGRMSGVFKHQRDCLANGIKPIIGIEMYTTPELVTMQEEKRLRGKNTHLILLASNEIGYKNLLRLNYLSNKDEEHFYYYPRISFKELFDNNEGIICGSACIGSPFANLLRNGRSEEAEQLFRDFCIIFKDRFYAEIQINELTGKMDSLVNGQISYNDWIIENANKCGVPIVITGDVHYHEPGMSQLQTIAIAVRDNATYDNITFELESKTLHYQSESDFHSFNEDFGYGYKKDFIDSCLNNSQLIADKINYTIPNRKRMIMPTLTKDDEKVFIEKTVEGLLKYTAAYNLAECPKEYKDRLLTEIEVITQKGFCSYFLVLEDIFRFAREQEIPTGAGRGSAGGSLVAFCLGITTIDPIKYGLLFERFLSKTRAPDVVYNYFDE